MFTEIRAKVLQEQNTKDIRSLENILTEPEIQFLEDFYDCNNREELLWLTEKNFIQKPICIGCEQPLEFISYQQGYKICSCGYFVQIASQ